MGFRPGTKNNRDGDADLRLRLARMSSTAPQIHEMKDIALSNAGER